MPTDFSRYFSTTQFHHKKLFGGKNPKLRLFSTVLFTFFLSANQQTVRSVLIGQFFMSNWAFQNVNKQFKISVFQEDKSLKAEEKPLKNTHFLSFWDNNVYTCQNSYSRNHIVISCIVHDDNDVMLENPSVWHTFLLYSSCACLTLNNNLRRIKQHKKA